VPGTKMEKEKFIKKIKENPAQVPGTSLKKG
jgi:hypothetical protein